MAIVRSFGVFQSTERRAALVPTVSAAPAFGMTYGLGQQYALIYASQPNVRTCVDFLARNIAQVGYHVFRRVSDTDRVRLADHQLSDWLEHPNPYTSRYRLFESYVADLALYFNAYWLKVREPDRIGLVRVPPPSMTVEGGLLPETFIYHGNTQTPFAPSEVVYANGYNPLNPIFGLSPIETLRRVLAEEAAAGEHRERYWRNASRMEGIIERPKDAPRWTPEQKQKWREQWQQRYTGPASVGAVPVLEDGMTFKEISYSMKDSDYLNARKLTREECAAAWHIPLPMVGILDHATFSNIKEQHKQLYQDCLGPWLEMLAQAIELQLLPDCQDTAGIYTEFNIADKMKGSFEEQADSLRQAVDGPIMTANEARSRLNLPRLDDPRADRLNEPRGGPSVEVRPGAAGAAVPSIVRAHWARQRSRLERLPVDERAEALNHQRCTSELAADLSRHLGRGEAWTYAARVTDETYTLLLEGRQAFGADREPRPVEYSYDQAA